LQKDYGKTDIEISQLDYAFITGFEFYLKAECKCSGVSSLSNNVPIETVSKMLGHTNIKTTQHYAKVLDLKVSNDMAQLKKKYALV
jgi:integrase